MDTPAAPAKALVWLCAACVAAGSVQADSRQANSCYQIRPEPARNNFVLCLDRSGSLGADGLRQAKAGALAFLAGMRPEDQAAIVSFGTQVRVDQPLTADRQRLTAAVGAMSLGGNTALYDAMACAAEQLMRGKPGAGASVMLFFTDGKDNASRAYSAPSLTSFVRSEAVFVYGIGLGDVDRTALEAICHGTGGQLEYSEQRSDLPGLHRRCLQHYYARYGKPDEGQGAMAILSLPAGRPVRIDGALRGATPLKLDSVAVGTRRVQVDFGDYTWDCRVPVAAGSRTYVDARKPEGGELMVVFRPAARVFIDGTYVKAPATLDVLPEELARALHAKHGLVMRIPFLPAGPHRVALRAAMDAEPGFWDLGVDFAEMDAQMETMNTSFFPPVEETIEMSGDGRILAVNFVTQRMAEALPDGTLLRHGALGGPAGP